MLKYIEKQFILDSTLTESQQRQRYATISSIVGVICNMILSVSKMICGILFSSISVLGDGINNLSDCGSSMITFIGFKLSDKPADKEHPFGHARIEYVSGFIVSFIILFVGFQLFLSSFGKILNPSELVYSTLTTVILMFSMMVKFWLFLFNNGIGKKIHSNAIIGVAKDSFNDIFITLGVLISSGLSQFWDINVDGYIGVFIALMVAKSGLDLAKDTLSPIIGEAPSPEFIKEIHDEIMSQEKVLGIHDLMVHNYGESRYFVSVHVEFDSKMEFIVCHEIADEIERNFESRGIQIVVHSDPVVTDSPEFDHYKKTVEDVLDTIDKSLNLHGFRYIKLGEQVKLLFDVVRPCDLKMTSPQLIEEIETELGKVNEDCLCVIRVDEHYNQLL